MKNIFIARVCNSSIVKIKEDSSPTIELQKTSSRQECRNRSLLYGLGGALVEENREKNCLHKTHLRKRGCNALGLGCFHKIFGLCGDLGILKGILKFLNNFVGFLVNLMGSFGI